jgi:hypothetical protein
MTTLTKVSADDFITEDRPAAFTVRAQTAPARPGAPTSSSTAGSAGSAG